MNRRPHSHAIVIAVKCSFCSRQKPPSRVTLLANGMRMCDYCFEWHCHATEVLAGAVPWGCQICQTTGQQMAERTPGDQVHFNVVIKDGIYQLVCDPCAEKYAGKRADLFGETQYGRNELKLN